MEAKKNRNQCSTHLLFILIALGICISICGVVLTMHGYASWCGFCRHLKDGPKKRRIQVYQFGGPLFFIFGVWLAVLGIFLKSNRKSNKNETDKSRCKPENIEGEINSSDSTDGENSLMMRERDRRSSSCDDTRYPCQDTYLTQQPANDNESVLTYENSPRVVAFPPPGQTYLQPWQPTVTGPSTKEDTDEDQEASDPLLPTITEESAGDNGPPYTEESEFSEE